MNQVSGSSCCLIRSLSSNQEAFSKFSDLHCVSFLPGGENSPVEGEEMF